MTWRQLRSVDPATGNQRRTGDFANGIRCYSDPKHPVSQAETRTANPPKHVKKRFADSDGLPPDQPWEQRIRSWRKNPKFWLNAWGPRPDQPGCFAPASVMR